MLVLKHIAQVRAVQASCSSLCEGERQKQLFYASSGAAVYTAKASIRKQPVFPRLRLSAAKAMTAAYIDHVNNYSYMTMQGHSSNSHPGPDGVVSGRILNDFNRCTISKSLAPHLPLAHPVR